MAEAPVPLKTLEGGLKDPEAAQAADTAVAGPAEQQLNKLATPVASGPPDGGLEVS